MASENAIKDRLDEIYGGDPAGFTEARNELARSLKADGESELAGEVKKLKRPTQAAATINRLSLGHANDIDMVLAAGAELRRVQENLGDPDAGERLKAASAAQREAIDAVLTLAAEELRASGATLDRVSETLHGTAGDEALADTVRAGRVEREGQAAGLGGALVPPPARAGKNPKQPAKPTSKAAAGKASARKRRAAEGKLKKAEDRLEATAAGEAEAMDRLRAAEKELQTARSVHEGAEKTLERAREAADKAKKELDGLDG